MYVLEIALDWYVQLPAAAAVVTTVIFFLRHLKELAVQARSQTDSHNTRMEKLGEDCHLHSEQQQEVFTKNLDSMATTFESTVDKIMNGKGK